MPVSARAAARDVNRGARPARGGAGERRGGAGPGRSREPAFRGLISGPDALLWNLEAPTLVAYFLRDMTAGATRCYLAMVRLEALWI